MSTEGFVSFIAKGERKDTYNNSDSYPSWLGVRVLGWLRVARDGGLPEAIARLRVVTDFGPARTRPTEADQARYAEFKHEGVGGPDAHWYQLLRELHGDPHAILAAGLAYGEAEPYGYIWVVDADTETFRLESEDGQVEASWSWAALPSDAEFLAALEA